MKKHLYLLMVTIMVTVMSELQVTGMMHTMSADLGVSTHALEDLRGGDGAENARFMRATFAGQGPAAHRDAVAVNAGAMFYLAGISDTMREGTERALSMLSDGSVETWQRTHEEADYRD